MVGMRITGDQVFGFFSSRLYSPDYFVVASLVRARISHIRGRRFVSCDETTCLVPNVFFRIDNLRSGALALSMSSAPHGVVIPTHECQHLENLVGMVLAKNIIFVGPGFP